MHYRIKLIGEYQSPRKPWLALGMDGVYHFAGERYAHKFDCIVKANSWLNHLKLEGKKVFMTWHGVDQSRWGEVNRDYLDKLHEDFFGTP